MFVEVFLSAPLFRTTQARKFTRKSSVTNGPRLNLLFLQMAFGAFALIFHYSVLVVIIRHFRFFLEPVPQPQSPGSRLLTGIMQVGSPRFFTGREGSPLCPAWFLSFPAPGLQPENCAIFPCSTIIFRLPLAMLALLGIMPRYFRQDGNFAGQIYLMAYAFRTHLRPGHQRNVLFVHLTLVCTLLIVFRFPSLRTCRASFQPHTQHGQQFEKNTPYKSLESAKAVYFTYKEYEDTYREAMARSRVAS